MPIYAIDSEFITDQIVGVADDDAIRFRIEIDNIARSERTTWQAFALADGEKLDAIMFTHKISSDIVNFASMKLTFAEMRAQESLVIVARDKADLLTVDLVGHLQAQRM